LTYLVRLEVEASACLKAFLPVNSEAISMTTVAIVTLSH
jgi:hypothetical protein